MSFAGDASGLPLKPEEITDIHSRILRTAPKQLFCHRKTVRGAITSKPDYVTMSFFQETQNLPLVIMLSVMTEVRKVNFKNPDREFDIFVFSNNNDSKPSELVIRMKKDAKGFVSFSYKKSKLIHESKEGELTVEKYVVVYEESCS